MNFLKRFSYINLDDNMALLLSLLMWFPDSSVGNKTNCKAGDPQFNYWVRKIHWRRDRLPTPVFLGSFVAQLVKNLVAMQQTWVRSLDWEDPLDKGKANHSRILSWRIPWTVESTASQRVIHNWETFTLLISCITSIDLCILDNPCISGINPTWL